MELLKINIIQRSLSGTEFKGDTFFGHLFLAIKYLYGEEKLVKIAELYESEPIFIVSDLFPMNKVPKPMFFEKKENTDIKKLKKIKWIEQGSSIEQETENIKFLEISLETKNTSITGEIEPFTLSYYNYINNGNFFMLINKKLLTEENINLNNLLKFISINGYGKKSNLGKGRFDFIIEENFEFKKRDKYMISSLCNEQNESFSNYDVKMKHGYTNNGIRKNQILLKTPGSVLNNIENKLYIGKPIYNKEEKYIEQGYSLLIPF